MAVFKDKKVRGQIPVWYGLYKNAGMGYDRTKYWYMQVFNLNFSIKIEIFFLTR